MGHKRIQSTLGCTSTTEKERIDIVYVSGGIYDNGPSYGKRHNIEVY